MKLNDEFKTNCSICNSKNIFFYYSELNLQLYNCVDCGLVFVNPPPEDGEYVDNLEFNYVDLANKYSKKLKKSVDADDNSKRTAMWENSKSCIFKADLEAIDKYLLCKNHDELSLLDVGCGEGHFLMEAKKKGYLCEGLEPSKTHTPKKAENLKIFCGFLKDFRYLKKYDVITVLDVLEHTKNPVEEIKCVRSIIKENGLLMIRVPNLKWLRFKEKMFRVFCILMKKDVLEINPQGIYAPHTHLFNFSEKSLTKLLESTGFKILGFEIINASLSTSSFFKKIFYLLYYACVRILFKISGINLAISLNVFARPV